MVPELSLLGPSNHGNVSGLPQVVPQGGGVDLAQVSVTILAGFVVCSLVPSPSLLPSLRQSGDPSPKGRFSGGDMGGVMNGLIAISEIVQASKLYESLLQTSTRTVFV